VEPQYERRGERNARQEGDGIVRFTRIRGAQREGNDIVLTRNGEISILDPKGRELESTKSRRRRAAGQEEPGGHPGTVLCQWDPHSIPILAEVSGKVRYEDIVEGETMRTEKDPSGHIRRIITEH
jgi:DNA-directed RNA polymerase subunit beta'